MFRIYFDTREFEDLADSVEDMKLDIEKIITAYINKVYRELHKQHSRKFTYQTPPNTKRLNLYRRSGRLMNELKQAKFVKKNGPGEWEAGFSISRGSYLWTHEGERGDPPTTITSKGNSQTFLGRMIIPLRAALNGDGTPKRITPRMTEQFLILPFHVADAGQLGGKKSQGKPINNRKALKQFASGDVKVDWNREDTKKFHPNSLIVFKRSGRKFIPMYVLAKEVKIPKRIFIAEKMEKYHNEVYDKLNDAIEKELKRLGR